MKLVHPNWEHQIKFIDGGVTLLVIENPITLREYIMELYNQIDTDDGRFCLSENNKLIKLASVGSVIINPLDLSCFDKEISNSLNAYLKKLINNEDLYFDVSSLISELCEFCNELCIQSDYPIEYTIPTPVSLLKLFNINLRKDNLSKLEVL